MPRCGTVLSRSAFLKSSSVTSLPTPDIVHAIALSDTGVIAGSKVKTFLDLSTTGPKVAAEVAAVADRVSRRLQSSKGNA